MCLGLSVSLSHFLLFVEKVKMIFSALAAKKSYRPVLVKKNSFQVIYSRRRCFDFLHIHNGVIDI